MTMTTAVRRVERETVVLPAEAWKAELTAELVKLGHDLPAAQQTSLAVLRGVLGRAGWPDRVFRIAERPAETPAEIAKTMSEPPRAAETAKVAERSLR